MSDSKTVGAAIHDGPGLAVDEFDSAANRHFTLLFILVLLGYVTLSGIWEAARRPLWFDEIFTATLARLSPGALLDALGHAADTSGPVYYAAQRAVALTGTDPHIVLRLPSILGCSIACLMLYLFARREAGARAGMIAVLVALVSQLYHGYSVEARPYALMVMCVTVAAVCWQATWRRPIWAWPLAACLGLSIGVHYYAAFLLMPFTVAELVATLRHRRIRWSVWAAIGAGAAVLATVWPLLSGIRTYYGAHYWSAPTLAKALATYDRLQAIGLPGGGFGIALALGGALVWLAYRHWNDPEVGDASHTPRPRPESIALALGLLAVPFVVFVVTRLMQGGYSERYAIGVVPGFALGSAYVAGTLDSRRRSWLALALALAFASHESVFWSFGGGNIGLRPRPNITQQQNVIAHASGLGLPVLVGNALDFLPLAYYGSPDPSIELVAPIDEEASLKYLGNDSLDRDLRVLREYMPINVVDFDEFAARHIRFLLFSTAGPENWWPSRLADDGYTLVVLTKVPLYTLYMVEKRIVPANPSGPDADNSN